MRNTFINTLINQARRDERIFVITPDLGFSVLEQFQKEFPDRFLNIGIAEQNAVGVAAGLALSGKIVYVYSIIPFITMRCFEQIRVDVAYMQTNVKLVGVGAGFSYGPQGATHHSIEDISIMRSLPNMTVCCPGDPIEVKCIVEESYKRHGPFYIRLGRSGEPKIHSENRSITFGDAIKVKDGSDLAIITTSNTLELAKNWSDDLESQGRSVTLISMPVIKPFDNQAILTLINKGIPIITLEEHSIIGGLGTVVAEVIAESGQAAKFKRIAIPDEFSHDVGGQNYLRDKFGLTLNEIIF